MNSPHKHGDTVLPMSPQFSFTTSIGSGMRRSVSYNQIQDIIKLQSIEASKDISSMDVKIIDKGPAEEIPKTDISRSKSMVSLQKWST